MNKLLPTASLLLLGALVAVPFSLLGLMVFKGSAAGETLVLVCSFFVAAVIIEQPFLNLVLGVTVFGATLTFVLLQSLDPRARAARALRPV